MRLPAPQPPVAGLALKLPSLLNTSPCPPLSLRLPRFASHCGGSLSRTQDTVFPKAPTAETRSPSIRIDHKKIVIDDKKNPSL